MSDAEFEVKVLETLESNRQWLREHNIAHAKFRLKKTKDPKDKSFWKAILESYGQLMQSHKGHSHV